MSERDGSNSEKGYETPVPELDDHRHNTASAQRLDRPRRGTVDTLYGSRQYLEADAPYSPTDVRVRDFEEAILDEDDNDVSIPVHMVDVRLLLLQMSGLYHHQIQ
ncbi:hypothetical protein RRF57_007612 [Xylaria bambusicola]|uniref:Uncharacterized protein n=1 Tax=Xylaria bambusicola TaxID=326684 RepID=A0AAN7ZAU2_9PEZI